MRRFVRKLVFLGAVLCANPLAGREETPLGKLTVTETAGLERTLAYADFGWQAPPELLPPARQVVVRDESSHRLIFLQIYQQSPSLSDSAQISFRGLFPVGSVNKHEQRFYTLLAVDSGSVPVPQTRLALEGDGLTGQVENQFYRVALSQKFGGDSTGNRSGQIRELHLKLGINQLLTNAEDHLHWAPNFHRPELDYYRTIAAWDPPAQSRTETGPYLIRTEREGPAPFHPEIRLSAVYRFLDGLPYFVFSSEMAFEEDLALDLLRNDEMTMDSMFTDLSFERPDGTVVTVPLAERYDLLKKAPIENESPWLCFFNRQQGFAFGSIRLQYDIRNRAGHPSPVFAPHTQIGEWLHGITYWNRRLVHDQLMVIPRGSRYREQNAYLVFRVGPDGSAEAIRAAARRLRQPLRIELSTP